MFLFSIVDDGTTKVDEEVAITVSSVMSLPRV